jgi:predicted transcriptional regulator
MLQDKSEPAASEEALAPARKNWPPAKKRQYAVDMKAKGFSAAEIAGKLGVSTQRVHQYTYEAAKKPKKAKKPTPGMKHAGNLHRLALKVQRGTLNAMQVDVNDYFLDVLLLCREILRES